MHPFNKGGPTPAALSLIFGGAFNNGGRVVEISTNETQTDQTGGAVAGPANFDNSKRGAFAWNSYGNSESLHNT